MLRTEYKKSEENAVAILKEINDCLEKFEKYVSHVAFLFWIRADGLSNTLAGIKCILTGKYTEGDDKFFQDREVDIEKALKEWTPNQKLNEICNLISAKVHKSYLDKNLKEIKPIEKDDEIQIQNQANSLFRLYEKDKSSLQHWFCMAIYLALKLTKNIQKGIADENDLKRLKLQFKPIEVFAKKLAESKEEAKPAAISERKAKP